MDSRSLKKLREVSSSIRDKVEENSKIVHYWSFTSTFTTEHLKKFTDEVQTVLGENEVLLQPSDQLTVIMNKKLDIFPLKNRGKGEYSKKRKGERKKGKREERKTKDGIFFNASFGSHRKIW